MEKLNQQSVPTSKTILFYLLPIFIISWSLQIFAYLATGDINSDDAEIWLVLTMFVPLVVTIIFLVKDKSLRKYVLWKPKFSVLGYIILATVVPTIIAFGVLFITQINNWGESGWFVFNANQVTISGGPFVLGTGTQNWFLFILNILLTAIVFSLFNGIPAAGEEFAWRGFFQSILTERLGTTKGIFLLGFIWSMWHLPAQLVGYNFPEYPIFGSFVISPIELIATSLFMGWLTIKSKSFIPAAVAHGAGNSIQEGVISNIKLFESRLYEDLTTLLITVLIGLFFMYLLRRKSTRHVAS
ncbi:MAG: CPBP family intramembrane metalloprotease [Cyclobacteriaceae bacterium]|jgi:membrane protease YdiL (CAAX protease family)|nr:CPBP family intramembrane metalloprotease [Cyclobacteriaceae bacterium]